MRNAKNKLKKGNSKYLIILLIIGIIILIGLIIFFAYLGGQKDSYTTNIPDFDNPLTKEYLTHPVSVMELEVDSYGNIFINDPGAQRVMVLDKNLKNLRNIGERYKYLTSKTNGGVTILAGLQAQESIMQYPGAIDINNQQNTVIISRLNKKILYYDTNFTLIKEQTIPQEILNQLEIVDSPNIDASELYMEILSNDNILIQAQVDNKILLLSPDLTIIKSLTLENGKISKIRKSNSGFYVIDSLNKKVIEYDNNLNKIGEINSEFKEPFDLCVLSDKLIITDKYNRELKVINKQTREYEKSYFIKNRRNPIYPTHIACSGQEKVIFVYDEIEAELLKLNLEDFLVKDRISSLKDIKIIQGAPAYIDISPLNKDVAVVDSQYSFVLILNKDLEKKKIIGLGFGDYNTKFKFPTGVVYDSSGYLHVIDRINRKIKIYDTNYNFVKEIKNIENCVADIESLDNKLIYADDTSNKVYVRDTEGKLLQTIKNSPTQYPYNNKGQLTPNGDFGSPHGIYYSQGKFYITDEEFPNPKEKYKVMINVFDSNFNFIERKNMPIPDSFGLSETIAVYGDIVIIPSNEENILYFFDMNTEKIIEKILTSQEKGLTAMEIDILEGDNYALVTNQKDGMLMKIDLTTREIVFKKPIADYYKL